MGTRGNRVTSVKESKTDTFLTNSINDSEDSFERMLAALRFTFSKDLKFIVSVACRPHVFTGGDPPPLLAREGLQALQLRSW